MAANLFVRAGLFPGRTWLQAAVCKPLAGGIVVMFAVKNFSCQVKDFTYNSRLVNFLLGIYVYSLAARLRWRRGFLLIRHCDVIFSWGILYGADRFRGAR